MAQQRASSLVQYLFTQDYELQTKLYESFSSEAEVLVLVCFPWWFAVVLLLFDDQVNKHIKHATIHRSIDDRKVSRDRCRQLNKRYHFIASD